MTTEHTTAGISRSVRAEAAAWVARLHSSDRSHALETGFKRWLEADPKHAQAFEIATAAWEVGGSIPPGALPRIADPFADRRRPSAFTRSALAVAAALSLAIVGALVYFNRGNPAVSTNVGEQRMLTLDDGSRIFLNTGTRLVVQESEARRHVQLETGEALFDATRNPARPFVVTAGDREVVALGTSFVVRRDPQELTVTLMEGKVAVESRANHSDAGTVLTPGQRLTFSDRHPPKLDEPALETVTAWRRGEIILDKTRLQDAADEMNRYSAIQLIIDDPNAADIRISGIFRAGDSARFALAVGETYHLAVRHEQRRIVIGRPQTF